MGIKNNQTQNHGLLSVVASSSTLVKKSALAAAVVKQIGIEYLHNADYYHDFVKFNFCNGTQSDKQYRKVCYYDLPVTERERLLRLKDRYFSGIATSEIYRRLGLPETGTNKTLPIETKWAYAYYKKYGHWDYMARNIVTDSEILMPLTSEEVSEYARMF